MPDDPPIPVCRRLRSKGMPGVAYDHAVSFEAGYITTATFWCVVTADPVGPDDNLAHPHTCVPGRACYRAPEPIDLRSDDGQ